MLEKLSAFVIQSTLTKEKRDREKKKEQKSASKSTKESKQFKINIEFIDKTLLQIFSYRKNESLLSSRIRFKIQDLMDAYNRDWKQIIYGDRQMEDDEGFKYRYVPKDALISEENISP